MVLFRILNEKKSHYSDLNSYKKSQNFEYKVEFGRKMFPSHDQNTHPKISVHADSKDEIEKTKYVLD